MGFPIRTSRDQRVLSPPPGLTQSATSFIASCCQGIHQTPLSRLIRSRRRRALLCEAGSIASTRLVSSVGSLWTRTSSSAKGTTPVAIDERPFRARHQITVSIRLGKTVFVADGQWPPTGASPTREAPEDVSCICSLDDVKCRDPLEDRTAKRANARLAIRSDCALWTMEDLPRSRARDWWVEKELNLRPHAYQACALTT